MVKIKDNYISFCCTLKCDVTHARGKLGKKRVKQCNKTRSVFLQPSSWKHLALFNVVLLELEVEDISHYLFVCLCVCVFVCVCLFVCLFGWLGGRIAYLPVLEVWS